MTAWFTDNFCCRVKFPSQLQGPKPVDAEIIDKGQSLTSVSVTERGYTINIYIVYIPSGHKFFAVHSRCMRVMDVCEDARARVCVCVCVCPRWGHVSV